MTEEEQTEQEYQGKNILKIGEIEMESTEPLTNLINYAVWLLRRKEVKEYLSVVNTKKKISSYTT